MQHTPIMKPAWHDGPRERLVRLGGSALQDAELIAILLGTGRAGEHVIDMARRLLDEKGGLAELSLFSAGALAAISGVGLSKACRIAAAFELGKRVSERTIKRATPLRSSEDIYAAMRPRFQHLDIEQFWAIPLDCKHRPVATVLLSSGGLSSCPISPSDAFRALMRYAAHSVVFIHNHPSGEPAPSEEDLVITERLRLAGELIGISVIDHVIVASEGYFSFFDSGLLGVSAAALRAS